MTNPIPIFRPDLMNFSTLSPFFDEIHAESIYSNFGPLLGRFEDQFEQRCAGGLHVCGLANGTLALQSAILMATGYARIEAKICLLPSFTFSASVSAVLAAGYEPHFVDVDERTWMIDPDSLRTHAKLDETGLVIVTAAFGAMPNLEAWATFSRETGIAVVIDAAACADAFLSGQVSATQGLPIALSFHVTKPFGIGEGGAVITDCLQDAELVRACSNFGFDETRVSNTIGINAKMSEIVAAIGLKLLEEWDERQTRMMAVVEGYHTQFHDTDGFVMVRDWVTAYPHFLPETATQRAKIITQLDAASIGHRRWWRFGCHTHPAYASFGRDQMPVTEDIADRMIGLPFFAQMTQFEIALVRSTVVSAL